MPSTAISSIAYDSEHRTLSIRFRPSGELYRYYDVPPRVHDAFLQAVAKGRYFNLHIRDRYPFQRIGDPDDGRHAA